MVGDGAQNFVVESDAVHQRVDRMDDAVDRMVDFAVEKCNRVEMRVHCD